MYFFCLFELILPYGNIHQKKLVFSPQDFLPILKKFEEAGVEVVYGTRFQGVSRLDFIRKWFQNYFGGAHHEIKRFHLFFGIQMLNVLANLLYGANTPNDRI